ncbi:MAG: hypothetical protein IJL12_01825 [Selenomonadaceae bacterium]|nr:hypothetical protein [Selenomonadaceae bacterium]MBQ7493476.1 hypothetical protein [Selenomonadaceae bacterium]
MTEQERINESLQRQIDAQNARIDNTLTKVDMMIEESKQQREDIRRAQEKYDADMREMRDGIRCAQEKHDTDMREMNQRFYGKIDDLSKQINDTWKQTMIGVGGMIIALGGLLIAALK